MESQVFFLGGLALILGVKHAFDVDHLVAVSTLLTRSDGMARTIKLASSWAAGHMVTAGLVTLGLFLVADTFLPRFLLHMELLVPLMLIVIGLVGLAVAARKIHFHRHAHADGAKKHAHVHVHLRSRRHEHGAMAGIGVVHGLASNDELLLVLVVGLGVSVWWHVLLGVALFSLGVLFGMVAYAAAIQATSGAMTRRFGWNWLPTALSVVFSVGSIAYAGHLLTGGDGLNLPSSAG